MSYILFHKETEIISVHRKQPNRTYYTIHVMEEIETEDELILRIKEIDSEYKYITEEEKRQKHKSNQLTALMVVDPTE